MVVDQGHRYSCSADRVRLLHGHARMELIALALVVLILVAIVGRRSKDIHATFGLSPSRYEILSSDLGKHKTRKTLRRNGVNGIPDAIFKSLRGKVIVIGELKARKARGMVKYHEFYQLTLYMGHAASLNPGFEVKGVLAYSDGHFDLAYDPDVYNALMGLRSEAWDVLKTKRISDSRPLHKRMDVRRSNRRVRFSTDL